MNIKVFVSGIGVDLQRGCNCVCITANRNGVLNDDWESVWAIRQRWIDTRLVERGSFTMIRNIILV